MSLIEELIAVCWNFNSALALFSLRALTKPTVRCVSIIKGVLGNFTPIAMTSNIFTASGTYNGITDTATFTNNSGGTFNVTGFTTGMYPAGVNEDVQYNNNGIYRRKNITRNSK